MVTTALPAIGPLTALVTPSANETALQQLGQPGAAALQGFLRNQIREDLTAKIEAMLQSSLAVDREGTAQKQRAAELGFVGSEPVLSRSSNPQGLVGNVAGIDLSGGDPTGQQVLQQNIAAQRVADVASTTAQALSSRDAAGFVEPLGASANILDPSSTGTATFDPLRSAGALRSSLSNPERNVTSLEQILEDDTADPNDPRFGKQKQVETRLPGSTTPSELGTAPERVDILTAPGQQGSRRVDSDPLVGEAAEQGIQLQPLRQDPELGTIYQFQNSQGGFGEAFVDSNGNLQRLAQ